MNAAGDVFIADTYNNRVVKVTPQGQVIATVAGDGSRRLLRRRRPGQFAELNSRRRWRVDAQGNLYIADSANNVIRRVDAKTGIITTVAGDYAADKANDGLGGFSGDGGPATSAQLNDPQGVAVDGAGDLFIADTFNNAIREVTPAGTISTVVNAAAEARRQRPAADRPGRVGAEHPLRGRDRRQHRRPLHRRHPQQQDRPGHRAGPSPSTAGGPGPAPTTPPRHAHPDAPRTADDDEETLHD